MRCQQHPERHAVGSCAVCGGWFCGDCLRDEPSLRERCCADCAARLPGQGRGARPRLAGFGFALPGLLLVGGLVAWLARPADPADAAPRRLTRALDTLAVACAAVDAWHLRSGEWPRSLDELGPDAPPLADPFADGAPLRWRQGPRGGLLYSVGPDGVDQGGASRDPLSGVGDLPCALP